MSRQHKERDSSPSPLSALRLGNSDPFHVYSIRLGPRETDLLKVIPGNVLPQQSPFAQIYKRWTNTSASDDRRRYAELLSNEVTAYGLLGRNAALEVPISESHSAALPTHVLYYMTMTQAALRRELKSLEHSPSTRNLHDVMWTASFLATIELSFGLSTADVHIAAMVRVMMRYVKAREINISIGDLIHLLFPDIMTAVLTFKRCHLDTNVWLPRISQYMWSLAKAVPSDRESIESKHALHEMVKDVTLRTVMLGQKALRETYDKTQENLSTADVHILCDAVCVQELLHLGQLVNLAVDTLKALRTQNLTVEQFQDDSATVYLSIAVQLWIRLASPTSLSNNAKFDIAPSLLLRLKFAMEQVECVPRPTLHRERLHAEAKLWALFIGAYTESQLRNSDSADAVWFRKAFQSQVRWMQIHSWEQAVAIFKEFLHCEYAKPPVSEWWSEVVGS